MCSWKVRFWKNENKVCSTWAGPSQRFWLNDILNTCFLACKTWIVSMYHQYWLYFCDYCNCIPHEFWNLMKDEFREKMCLKVWRSFLLVFFFFSAGRRGGEGWASNQIFKKGVLDRTSTFTGRLLEKREMTFFREGCNFHIKYKLKSQIFNDKNSL